MRKDKTAMRASGGSDIRRIPAGIMGIMMLVCVVFSALFIAVEAGHDCTGEDCPVCICIEQCENILGTAGDGGARIFLAAPVVFLIISIMFSVLCIGRETPVSKKVRLNN